MFHDAIRLSQHETCIHTCIYTRFWPFDLILHTQSSESLPPFNLLFLLFEVLSIDWQAAQLLSGSTNYHVGSYQDMEISGTPPGSLMELSNT